MRTLPNHQLEQTGADRGKLFTGFRVLRLFDIRVPVAHLDRWPMSRLPAFPIVACLIVLITSLLAADKTMNAVPKVAITNLLAHMKEYRGKRVEVTGFYKSGFELSALYENQEDAKQFRDERALWIMPLVKPGHETQVKFVKEGTVRVVGVFDYNARQPELGVGHLNGWPAQIVALELFEEIK